MPLGSIVTSINMKILSPGSIEISLKTTPDSPSIFILKGELVPFCKDMLLIFMVPEFLL